MAKYTAVPKELNPPNSKHVVLDIEPPLPVDLATWLDDEFDPDFDDYCDCGCGE